MTSTTKTMTTPRALTPGAPTLRGSAPIIGCAIAFASCAHVAAQPVPASVEPLFDRYEVVTTAAARQTVLTGFLLGGAMAELAVVHVDEDGDRRVRIHTFADGAWAPSLDAVLGPHVTFVDVANIGGRDRLITYEPGRLNWFDPASAVERPLVAVRSSFAPPRSEEIPHVDVTRDLNGDGRHDLAVPDVDGFWVFVQMSDGTFADPVQIGSAARLDRIYGAGGYRYAPWAHGRVHSADYDLDGRVDLMFWNENHFQVHRQDERGLFAAVGTRVDTEVGFDSDDLSELATGDLTGRVLHSLSDLNGDGVADLVVVSLEGQRIADKRSGYEVHFGAPAPLGGTRFGPEVGRTFNSLRGIQLALDRYDFDRDGQADLMFTTIGRDFLEGSLWKRIKGAMGDDIWLELEFYRGTEAGFPDTPSATRRLKLEGAPSHRSRRWVPLEILLRGRTHERRNAEAAYARTFNTHLLVGDVTGDGRADLLLEATFRGLDLFVGVPGPELFASSPQTVAATLPNDEEYSWLVDLNQDGVQDILLHNPFTDRNVHGAPKRPPGTEAHQVTLLVARSRPGPASDRHPVD